ncbi:MAG: tetraacyldisaccharide 4'-kinase [Bacteroidota bacterium]
MRKIILFPFSVLYAFGTSVRNFLFDRKLNRSIEFDLPVIGVGNLAIGGQGKTPMVEYLIELSKEFFKTGVLSRGYGRKTKGFLKVELTTVTSDCGDEPLQVKQKFPEAMVCVCEDRATGIPLMIGEDELDLILLDDAFQHRWVKPGLNILLSDFNAPFFNDLPLPAGNLRESRNGYRRADLIVFTRCTEFPDEIIRKNYLKKIPVINESKVFFAGLEYGEPHLFFSKEKLQQKLIDFKKVLLVCGIAQPKYLMNYLHERKIHFEALLFSDHHEFTPHDFRKIVSEYEKLNDESAIILTTEKDAVRLMKFKDESLLLKERLFALPIKMKFQPEEKIRFDKIIFDFVRTKLHYNN